jgi:hypothetical protein
MLAIPRATACGSIVLAILSSLPAQKPPRVGPGTETPPCQKVHKPPRSKPVADEPPQVLSATPLRCNSDPSA